MLLSIKSWLFETPSKDCMASYAKSGDNRYLEQLIALYSNDLYHYSGSVGLCGLKFVQTRGDLIAARGLQPSGLSQNRATKSKLPLGRTRRAAPVWH